MTKRQNSAERRTETTDETLLPATGASDRSDWLPSLDELFADPKVSRRVGDVIASAALRRPSPKS